MNSSTASGAAVLVDTVVEGGYCIGCGACAVPPDSPMTIELDDSGRYRARIDAISETESSTGADLLALCPFSADSAQEDAIASELFSANCRPHKGIGYHCATYAGHVADQDFRDRGSSGGMGSWILTELLKTDHIDAVIHVGVASPNNDRGVLFEFQVSRTEEQIRARAKSRYYPVEMSGVLREVLQRPGRYALVGLPCFVKAYHLLARQMPELRERVHFTLGIVCGHLKSTRFADLFAWQNGIEPGNLGAIDFRKKIPGQPASHYGIEVTGDVEGEEVNRTRTNIDYYGSNWGHGFFKYEACDYCDDVLAETADVSVGDAWLPGYVDDSFGTNIVVARNPLVRDLIDKGIAEGRLNLDVITGDQVEQSQEGGLRHRRDGLSYRLHLKDRAGEWRPSKRVEPREDHLTPKRKRIYELRMALASLSHLAFREAVEAKNFDTFKARLQPLIEEYNALYAPPFPIRILRGIRRRIVRVVRAFLPR